jgi:tetratricopeptide (TPR) repeat protein
MTAKRQHAIFAACLCATLVLAESGCNRFARRARQTARPAPVVERPAPAPPPKVDPVQESQRVVENAQILQAQGIEDVALREFERAISINPRITPAYLGIGQIQRRRGNLLEALTAYARAVDIEPGNFEAQYGLGLTSQLLGRIADAIRAYVNALYIRPDDFDANLNLATAYLQFGEPSPALPYAQRAVRLKGDSGPARFNLGAIYSAAGDHESAIVEYQQAAELMEISPQLLLNLAEALAFTGRHAEAQNTLEQLILAAPTAAAHERLATSLFRQKKYDEALAAFRRSIAIDDTYYPAHNGVGVCLLNRWLLSEKKDVAAKEEAIRALKRSLQLERKQPVVIDLINRYGS